MVLILMGVSGSGKTTVGKQLSVDLDWPFFDGDAFHSDANIEKMRKGIALSDQDRTPWLQALAHSVDKCLQQERPAIFAISALKQKHREMLERPGVHFIYLKGDFVTIKQRLLQRKAHFFAPELLQSQFDSLEEPKQAMIIDIRLPLKKMIETICTSLCFHESLHQQ